MRSFLIAASVLILTSASSGIAVAQQANAPSQQPAAAQKPGTPDTETQRQADEALHTRPGWNGKQEPKPVTPKTENDPVLVNGILNVPGADPNGQTVPAKYSKRNDAIDRLPAVAHPLALNDEQKRMLRDSIREAKTPVASIDAQVTQELPNSVPVYDLSPNVTAVVPGLRGLKYVLLKDKILLIDAANKIVVAEVGT